MDWGQIGSSLVEGNVSSVESLLKQALAEGMSPLALISGYLTPAMDEVGRRFECGDTFIPEMMASARAMQHAIGLLKPHLSEGEIAPRGGVVVGTVHGDMHEIGKSLVCMMLAAAGFEIHDLGVDVTPERFVDAVRRFAPRIVALSALLTTTMANMNGVIKAIEEAGLRGDVLVMVGGAPVTRDFADQIGADGYAADAVGAVRKADQLLGRG